MKLDKYLDEFGFNRSQLSRGLEISRAAISKWDDIPEKWMSQLFDAKWLKERMGFEDFEVKDEVAPVENPVKKLKDWDEYTLDEIRELCHRRRGEKVKRMVGGKEVEEWEYEEDWEIAASLGLKTWQFSRMLDKLRDIGKRKVAGEILDSGKELPSDPFWNSVR